MRKNLFGSLWRKIALDIADDKDQGAEQNDYLYSVVYKEL